MDFFESIKSNECLEEDYDAIIFIDTCFEEVKIFVEQSIFTLNASRTLFRFSNKEEALNNFFSFKELCLSFLCSMDEVKGTVERIGQRKKLDKLFISMQEIVDKTTQREIRSKIPLPHTDYLKTNEITEFDIDLMLKKLKNFWGKFLQVYGSLRIDIVLTYKHS